MAREIIGLKAGASRLIAARMSANGTTSLVEVASHELPPGLIVRGEPQSPEALAEELTRFFKTAKLPKKGIRLGVASNRLRVRTMEIEGDLTKDEMADAVAFRAQEDLPIPIMDAALDYNVFDEAENEDGEKVSKVLVAVAYRDLIEGFAAAFAMAGIRLAGVDLEALALLRSLTPPTSAAPGGGAPSATVMVEIGFDHSVIAITDGRVLEYARTIEWGGESVTEAMAEGLSIERDDAEQLKRAVSDAYAGDGDMDEIERVDEIGQIIDGQINTFAREFVSTLQYYQGQPDSLAISEVVLAGGGARLAVLASTLEGLTGVPVSVGDPTVRLARVPKGEDWMPAPEFAVPVGLGLAQ